MVGYAALLSYKKSQVPDHQRDPLHLHLLDGVSGRLPGLTGIALQAPICQFDSHDDT